MGTIKDLLNLKFDCDTAVAIGNFDGVHLGHQALISDFINESKNRNLKSIVLTFKPHPALFFNNELENFLIQSYESKLNDLKALGVDYIYECRFDDELRSMSASYFITNYLLKVSRLKLVFLGHDFKLGNGKEDAFEILRSEVSERQIVLKEFDSYKKDNTVISSTLIRETTAKSITLANKYLGKTFSLEGKVTKGLGIGRNELFATINIEPDKKLLKPASGVYIGRVKNQERFYDAVINIGINPTIGHSDNIKYEAHLLHVTGIKPDDNVTFYFLKKIREEIKFSSKKELREQISSDIEEAKNFLREVSDIKLALIGKNIQHSKSRDMYEKLLERSVNYTLLDCESERKIPSLNELKERFHGVSITAPYKQFCLDQGKVLNPKINSVNTIIFSNPITLGNTDYLAVKHILNDFIKGGIKKFIILGDGNMGKMTLNLLEQFNYSPDVYSRKKNNLPEIYNDSSEFNESTLIINTCAREYIFEPQSSGVYSFWDMNYARDDQRSLLEKQSIKYYDGLEMLELQAKYALNLWGIK